MISVGVSMSAILKNRVQVITLLVALAPSFLYAGTEVTNDPFEGYNRIMFSFNETADKYAIKPVVRGYRAVTPDPMERAVRRVFSNLGEIRNLVNDALQGKPKQMVNDSGRFLINSTLGVAGLFDVAEKMGISKSDGEDFGQTMGKWGLSRGPYLVLPFLGPSTLRDAPGRYVDSFLNPVGEIDHIPTRNTVYGTDILTLRAELLETEKLITGDKYVFLREVYLQRREYLVKDGEVDDGFGADFDDEDAEYEGF